MSAETVTLREYVDLKDACAKELSELKLQHERDLREAHEKVIEQRQARIVTFIFGAASVLVTALHWLSTWYHGQH